MSKPMKEKPVTLPAASVIGDDVMDMVSRLPPGSSWSVS
jgi:hypothetical protein